MSADQTVATGLALLAAQPPLEPGQLLENVRLTVRGILRARRDHSASISFLELSDGSTDEAGQMLQVCINRAKCDDTPGTRHALEQLNIGDTLCCAGPPGRTRTGRAEPTLFARSVELVRATREPARVLRLLAAWRAGELGIDETSSALGADPSLLRALLPALGPALAASRSGPEAQQQRAKPGVEENDDNAAQAPLAPRLAPARLERLREVAARRQAGLVLVMEYIHHVGNVGAMLRSCEAFGVTSALLVHAQRGEGETEAAPRLPLGCDVEGAMRGSSASADVWVELQHIEGTAAAFAWLEERGYVSVGTALHASRSTALYATRLDVQPRLALWMGNEARGLSDAAVLGCAQLVHIPMAGLVESLNVAACTAVSLAEIVRQRGASDRSFAPSEAEAAATFERLCAANSRMAAE